MEMLLRRGELLALDGNLRGSKIRCGDGSLWITQAGDSRDHILHTGGEFEVERRGRVALTALSDVRVRIARRQSLSILQPALRLRW